MYFNQKEAVYKALDLIGDKTSLEDLSKEASKYWRLEGIISEQICSSHRSGWRKIKGLATDCRTYEGQPERNMINGSLSKNGKALYEFQKETKIQMKILEDLLSKFSGLDQIRQTIRKYQEYSELKTFFEAG